jgi:hypothetical protein
VVRKFPIGQTGKAVTKACLRLRLDLPFWNKKPLVTGENKKMVGF